MPTHARTQVPKYSLSKLVPIQKELLICEICTRTHARSSTVRTYKHSTNAHTHTHTHTHTSTQILTFGADFRPK